MLPYLSLALTLAPVASRRSTCSRALPDSAATNRFLFTPLGPKALFENLPIYLGFGDHFVRFPGFIRVENTEPSKHS